MVINQQGALINPVLFAGIKDEDQKRTILRAKNRSQLREVIKAETITALVFTFFDQEYAMTKIRSQVRDLTEPRQISCYIVSKETSLTHEQISNIINRDRTTVMYSLEEIEGRIGFDKNFRNVYNSCYEYVQNEISNF